MYRLDRECKVARVKAVRGSMTQQVEVLLALTPDDLVPQDHPIRRIKPIVEGVPKELSPVFNRMYSQVGRPSIPPEHLLKANLLIALYSIRSEPATGGFCERLQYDLLFKWFLDMNIMDPAPSASLKTCFDPTTFSKNRTRLLDHEVAPRFFQTVVSEARRHRLLSEEHFSVDGTLLEAWASMKSLRPKDDDQEASCRERRTQPLEGLPGRAPQERHPRLHHRPRGQAGPQGTGARGPSLLLRAHPYGQPACGGPVDVLLTQATGTAGREAALEMLERYPSTRRLTVGADRGYDTRDFVETCRFAGHNTPRGQASALPFGWSYHPSSWVPGQPAGAQAHRGDQRWIKRVAGGAKLRYRGVARNQLWPELTTAVYTLLRMAKLLLPGARPRASCA